MLARLPRSGTTARRHASGTHACLCCWLNHVSNHECEGVTLLTTACSLSAPCDTGCAGRRSRTSDRWPKCRVSPRQQTRRCIVRPACCSRLEVALIRLMFPLTHSARAALPWLLTLWQTALGVRSHQRVACQCCPLAVTSGTAAMAHAAARSSGLSKQVAFFSVQHCPHRRPALGRGSVCRLTHCFATVSRLPSSRARRRTLA